MQPRRHRPLRQRDPPRNLERSSMRTTELVGRSTSRPDGPSGLRGKPQKSESLARVFPDSRRRKILIPWRDEAVRLRVWMVAKRRSTRSHVRVGLARSRHLRVGGRDLRSDLEHRIRSGRPGFRFVPICRRILPARRVVGGAASECTPRNITGAQDATSNRDEPLQARRSPVAQQAHLRGACADCSRRPHGNRRSRHRAGLVVPRRQSAARDRLHFHVAIRLRRCLGRQPPRCTTGSHSPGGCGVVFWTDGDPQDQQDAGVHGARSVVGPRHAATRSVPKPLHNRLAMP